MIEFAREVLPKMPLTIDWYDILVSYRDNLDLVWRTCQKTSERERLFNEWDSVKRFLIEWEANQPSSFSEYGELKEN